MKLAYIATGWVALIIGAVGVFLPVLPTTPFLLLAAFCFSRASPRLHAWIYRQPLFGPALRDWDTSGVIRLPAKKLATVTILVGFSIPLFVIALPMIVRTVLVFTAVSVLIFIWTRPSVPPPNAS